MAWGCDQVSAALLKAGKARGHGADLGMFPRELQELRHVRHDVFAGQQKVQLGQAQGVAFQLLDEKGFHAVQRVNGRRNLQAVGWMGVIASEAWRSNVFGLSSLKGLTTALLSQ
jgi:hypothetical protein